MDQITIGRPVGTKQEMFSLIAKQQSSNMSVKAFCALMYPKPGIITGEKNTWADAAVGADAGDEADARRQKLRIFRNIEIKRQSLPDNHSPKCDLPL
jgi:hypothetical protein